jgi:predicted transglutaminase-like cysteine proteinase
MFASSALAEAPSPFMETYTRVWPTRAARIFCMMNPDECRQIGGLERVVYSSEKEQQLVFVHAVVNATVTYKHDIDQYGMLEWWALPKSGYGDCEDYAWEIRRQLIGMGWPSSALLITIVSVQVDGVSKGHVVVTARTTAGDLIIDSDGPLGRIKLWHETAYHFNSRQTIDDPEEWDLLFSSPAGVTMVGK